MIKFTSQTATSPGVVLGAAVLLAGQLQYPPRSAPYELQQVRSTYSEYPHQFAMTVSRDLFAEQLVALYNTFAERQIRLGAEFEAAIFRDLESLYED